jgi:hypothetical protein
MNRSLAFLMLLFSTSLVQGAPGLEEEFEGATFPPTGWTTTTAGLPLPHAWHRTTDPDYRGSGKASAFVGSDSPGAIDEWLISPVVALAETDKALTFSWSGSTQWSSVLDASVNIREAGTTAWTRLWSITANESPADPFVYRRRVVDLSAWIGKRVHFGFRVAGTKGASFGLDDIVVGDFAPAALTLLRADTTCSSGGASPWRVVRVREPWAEDVPFETKSGYLRSSIDRNVVRGPDSLTARVAIVARRGYVEIVDNRTGASRRLLETPASLPQWSPDGRHISCVVWKSHLAPHQLAVVDVATSTVVVDSVMNASGTESKWSPDSRSIVASGLMNGGAWAVLYRVSIPDGQVTVLDSVDVLSTHEFSWSPDGRWIAFSRPTLADGHFGTTAAGLWIADAATGESWCVLDSREWAEMNPLWIADRSLQVTRVLWHEEGASEEQRVVVELSHVADLRR